MSSYDRSSGNLGRRKSLVTLVITIILVCFAGGIVYWVWAGKGEADRVRQLDQARLESEKLVQSVEEAKRRNIELQRRLKAEEDARPDGARVRMEAENARAPEDARVAAEADTEAKSELAVRASEEEARRASERKLQRRLQVKEDARRAESIRMKVENARAAEEAKVAVEAQQRRLKAEEDARREAERVRMEADARAAEDARVAAEAQARKEAESRTALLSSASRRREFATLGSMQPESQRSTGLPSSEASPDRAPASPRPLRRRTAQQLCANHSILVTRAICEAHWCATPEHSEEAICKQGRVAQSGDRRRDAGY